MARDNGRDPDGLPSFPILKEWFNSTVRRDAKLRARSKMASEISATKASYYFGGDNPVCISNETIMRETGIRDEDTVRRGNDALTHPEFGYWRKVADGGGAGRTAEYLPDFSKIVPEATPYLRKHKPTEEDRAKAFALIERLQETLCLNRGVIGPLDLDQKGPVEPAEPSGSIARTPRSNRQKPPDPTGGEEDIEDDREDDSEDLPKEKASSRSKRKSALPDDWEPSDDGWTWAEREYPALDLKTETAKFLHHHRALGSERADWASAWRKWIMVASEKNRPSIRRGPGGIIPLRNVAD